MVLFFIGLAIFVIVNGINSVVQFNDSYSKSIKDTVFYWSFAGNVVAGLCMGLAI